MADSCGKDDRCCSRTRIDPFRPNARGCGKIEPCGVMDLARENTELMICWAAEQIQATGTDVDYFSQASEKATLDPLYNEPEHRVWDGPYRFRAHVDIPAAEFEAREEGARRTWSSTMWIPLRMIESSSMPNVPAEGDVVRIWKIKFFDDLNSIDVEGGSPPPPGAGYFFDVTQVMEDGHVFDQPAFTGFKLTLKRRTEFTPERRLTNET